MERQRKSMNVKVDLDAKTALPVLKTVERHSASRRQASFLYHTYTHTHTHIYKKKDSDLTSTLTQKGEYHA